MSFAPTARRGTYCGPNEKLYGLEACVKPDPDNPGIVLARFDKPIYIGGQNLALVWSQFFRRYFTIHD